MNETLAFLFQSIELEWNVSMNVTQEHKEWKPKRVQLQQQYGNLNHFIFGIQLKSETF